MQVNIVILIFNLFIPAYPLDGGRIVADSLLMMGIPEETCGKIMAGVSLPLALGIIIYGFIQFSPVSVLVSIHMNAYSLSLCKWFAEHARFFLNLLVHTSYIMQLTLQFMFRKQNVRFDEGYLANRLIKDIVVILM